MNRTQAIEEFLKNQTHKIDLYTPEMEVQVNVIQGSKRNGRTYHDDDYKWYNFRIPSQSDSTPSYNDLEQNFPLSRYAQAIGLTGWNWFKRQSEYVGFDIDSLLTHKVGLSDDELDSIRNNVKKVPWITLRKSKSGKGYHIYVRFATPVPTENHTEHAALARAILSQISALIGLDFSSKVDAVGGVLWIWHKDAKSDGFQVIQQGESLESVPSNWREHVSVKGRKKPKYINPEESVSFEKLVQQTKAVNLGDDHLKLLHWFANKPYTWWWDADNNLLVCHTSALKQAHTDLNFRGIFYTKSKGSDPADYNCFAFPIKNGAWVVRRFGVNTQETEYWTLDNSGWRKAYFNRLPDLDIAAKMHKGVKAKNGSFSFTNLRDAISSLRLLGVTLQLTEQDSILKDRATFLIPGDKENEVIVSVERLPSDGFNLADWAPARGKKWERIVECLIEIRSIEPPDNLVRYATRSSTGYGWFVNSRNRWVLEQKDNARSVLVAMGYPRPDIENIFGQAILNDWEIVNKPFSPEYPGNRQWNINAIQLSCQPKNGECPTFELILKHVGKNIQVNDWCKKYGIFTGAEYLLYLLAAAFQYPDQPLPYTFLYGDQDSGKSIFHEMIRFLLLHERGYIRADHALTAQSGFNGELENALFCVVEEINLHKDAKAADRLKDWVTARTIAIRKMQTNVFSVQNTTHWIQCANSATHCPVFPGDTRINVIHVEKPDTIIPKFALEKMLLEEVPYFLHKLVNLKIPDSESRLRIPVLNSDIKSELMSINATSIQQYIDNNYVKQDGYVISFKDFVSDFYSNLDDGERLKWTERKISAELVGHYTKGRYGDGGQIHIANLKSTKGLGKKISDSKITRDAENRLRYDNTRTEN